MTQTATKKRSGKLIDVENDVEVGQSVDAESNGHPEGDELTDLKQECERLRQEVERLHRHDAEVRDAESRVQERERLVDALKAELKEAKDAFDDAVAVLRAAIRRRDSGQNELPFPEEQPPESPHDRAGDTPLSELRAEVDGKAWKIPPGQLEKLAEAVGVHTGKAGATTVSELEAYMAAGKFVPGSIKGLGQTAIDKVTDLLAQFRAANPVPTGDEPPAPDPVELLYELFESIAVRIDRETIAGWEPGQFNEARVWAEEVASCAEEGQADMFHADPEHPLPEHVKGWLAIDQQMDPVQYAIDNRPAEDEELPE